MSFNPIYYTGYEEDDEELSDSLSMSSEDEVEKDVQKFLHSKNIKSPQSKATLADDFESEMNDELNNLIEQKKNEYFPTEPLTVKEAPTVSTKEIVSDKPSVYDKKFKPNDMDINYEIEDTDSEEELATGLRCKKKKPQFTNDDLFYDPEMDEDDQNWINKQRKTSKKIASPKKPITSFSTEPSEKTPAVIYKAPNSDAVLNCPCCMTLLTMDCQRHETYKTQYRAMFVFNCTINEEEQLKYPKHETNMKKFKKKSKKKLQNIEAAGDAAVVEMPANEEFDLYQPVACSSCNTSVGVYRKEEEIYHFFNVLTGHS